MSQKTKRPACCCLQDIQAVTQVAVDQLVGYGEVVRLGGFPADANYAIEHGARVASFLQDWLDKLAEAHGSADAAHICDATSALLKHMAQ